METTHRLDGEKAGMGNGMPQGKLHKVRGREEWFIRYCYAGRRGEVRFGRSTDGDEKYICWVGANCWYADSFDEAVSSCRKKVGQIGGFVD